MGTRTASSRKSGMLPGPGPNLSASTLCCASYWAGRTRESPPDYRLVRHGTGLPCLRGAGASGKERQRGYMSGTHCPEVTVVHGGDLGDTQPFGHRDHGGIGMAEGEVRVLIDQLR